MSNWTEVIESASDEERQKAFQDGVGGYGGNEQDDEVIRPIVMPSSES
ncbi:MAG: hypothetical protein WC441_04840 [Patescibacteria group bacterium]